MPAFRLAVTVTMPDGGSVHWPLRVRAERTIGAVEVCRFLVEERLTSQLVRQYGVAHGWRGTVRGHGEWSLDRIGG